MIIKNIIVNTVLRNQVTDNVENTEYVSGNTPSMIITGSAGMAQSFAVTTKIRFIPLERLHELRTLANEVRYEHVAFGQCTETKDNFDELPKSDTGDFLHRVFSQLMQASL